MTAAIGDGLIDEARAAAKKCEVHQVLAYAVHGAALNSAPAAQEKMEEAREACNDVRAAKSEALANVEKSM